MGVHDGHRQRKREQFLNHGLDSMAEHEALELLLYYAIPRRDTNPLAHELIDRFGSLAGVLAAPWEELAKAPGMGANAAALIALVPQLYRRARASAANEVILDSVERIGTFFREQFAAQNKEILYQLCLDAKGRMLCCKTVCEGDSGGVTFNVRKIVENALLSNAVMVALAHNHPSGFAVPSDSDIVFTREVRDALAAIHVELVDHIVVADDDYVSMRRTGLLG